MVFCGRGLSIEGLLYLYLVLHFFNFTDVTYLVNFVCTFQSKISSYRDRYGDDPDDWPLTQSVVLQPDSSSHSNSSGADDDSDPLFISSRPHPLKSERSFSTVTAGRDQRSGSRERGEFEDSSDVSQHHVEISWQVKYNIQLYCTVKPH